MTRAAARAGDARVPARRPRRARARRRSSSPASTSRTANTLIVERADLLGPLAAVPDPRPRRPLRRTAHAYLLLPRRRRAVGRGPRAARDPRRPHRARLGLPHRDARPGAARRRQPARRRAVGARRRGRLRAVLRACWPRRSRSCQGGAGRRAARRRRSASTRASTPTCPPTTCALEATKIDIHRRIALAGSVDDLRELRGRARRSLRPGRPSPCENLLLLQEARLKLGAARA